MDNQDKQLWDLLGQASRVNAPKDFVSSAMQKIKATKQDRPAIAPLSGFAKFKQFFTIPRLSWVSAGAAVASVCALIFIKPATIDLDGIFAGNSISLTEIDDDLLMDIARYSLGDESLQDALYQISSIDDQFLNEQKLAEMLIHYY